MHNDNTLNLILDVCGARGAAPATRIVMCQVMWDRMVREHGEIVDADFPVPVTIDNTVPKFPGFQIHRNYDAHP